MSPFLAPAISNIVMIDGLPVNKSSCFGHKGEYGYLRYNEYNKKTNLFHLKPNIYVKGPDYKNHQKDLYKFKLIAPRGFEPLSPP